MTAKGIVVGIFANLSQAEQALQHLRQEGFHDDQISFLAQDKRTKKAIAEDSDVAHLISGRESEKGTATGVVAGGITGGLAGVAVGALLIPGVGPLLAGGIFLAALGGGAAIGAATGGLVGTMIGIGLPEQEARYYDNELRQGRVLVVVHADHRTEEALQSLQQSHALHTSTSFLSE
jgi:uncharacterized membrane protein